MVHRRITILPNSVENVSVLNPTVQDINPANTLLNKFSEHVSFQSPTDVYDCLYLSRVVQQSLCILT